MTNFVTVGKHSEFPKGVMRAFALGDTEIVVVNTGRNYYSFLNVCTHRAERLSDGFVEDENVVCAYHETVFEMSTGEPLEGPAFDPITIFPARVVGDDVEVGVPDDVDTTSVVEVKHEVGYVGD